MAPPPLPKMSVKAFARFTPNLLHSPLPHRLRNVTAGRRPDAAQSATTTPEACLCARDAQHRPPDSTTKMTPTQQYHRGESERSPVVAVAIRQPQPSRSLPLPAAARQDRPLPAWNGLCQPEQAACARPEQATAWTGRCQPRASRAPHRPPLLPPPCTSPSRDRRRPCRPQPPPPPCSTGCRPHPTHYSAPQPRRPQIQPGRRRIRGH